jgi:hypothetical protein
MAVTQRNAAAALSSGQRKAAKGASPFDGSDPDPFALKGGQVAYDSIISRTDAASTIPEEVAWVVVARARKDAA